MRRPRVASEAFRRLPPAVRSGLLHLRGDYVPWEEGFDFTPPTMHPGEVTGPPDFVGIGAQKSGTSWWYTLLLEHPDVSDRPDIPKERHYLSRFCVEPFGAAEIRRYHGWFPRRPGTVTGEWTPDYLPYPWVPPLLALAAPDAKVLVLLRDPVERFRSGVTFRLSQGAPPTSATVADAVRHGFYARHLKDVFASIPRDQVLVQQYEQCRTDPLGQLAVTYGFLGLAPFEPTEVRREINVGGSTKVPLDEGARRRLVDLYAEDVEELARMVPSIDLALWPNFATGAA